MNTKRAIAPGKGTVSWARTAFVLGRRGERAVVYRGERRGRSVHVAEADVSRAVEETASGKAALVGYLSPRVSFARWLDVPLAARAKALKVAPSLLDIQLPFPLEECLHTFVAAVPTDDGKTRCLAAAARCADVEAELAALGERELDPLVLDHEGLALWTQALREFPVAETSESCRAVVSLNGERSCVAFGRGVSYVSSHGFREENVDQLARLLHALSPDAHAAPPPVEWIWCGDGAGEPVRLAAVRDALVAGGSGDSRVADQPEAFLPRALLTRALLSGPLRCNLRVGSLLHSAMARRAARNSVAAALFLVLTAAALFAGNVVTRKHLAAREAALDREFASLRDALLGYSHNAKGEKAVEMVRVKLEKDRRELAPFLAVFRPGVSATLREVMTTGKAEGLVYNVVTLGKDQAVISGTAPDWDRPQVLADVLAVRGYNVRADRKSATEDERVPFTIVERGTP